MGVLFPKVIPCKQLELPERLPIGTAECYDELYDCASVARIRANSYLESRHDLETKEFTLTNGFQ
jgi:hypothetical protein